eukprot:scaffold103723_cov12-Tisochrysis_lutea.AAC.1
MGSPGSCPSDYLISSDGWAIDQELNLGRGTENHSIRHGNGKTPAQRWANGPEAAWGTKVRSHRPQRKGKKRKA